ncbi:MAG: tetratricopeptide repeat protein [Anaerolineae bacterium]|nr:tetratricopeptide repeat protein [Gemmatimonadaceae bacterium]
MDRSSLISDLERQFSENPRRVFARLANEYRKTGDSDRAIEMCRAHIPQQPGYISGHIVLGQALFDRGELDDARQTFETALALDPENLIALRQMGDISRQRGDTNAAQNWYQRLLDVDPQNEEITAIVASMSPSSPAGTASTAATAPVPTPIADPMAGWGQVDAGTESITEAVSFDNSKTYGDLPAISDAPLELLGAPSDLLTDSNTAPDSGVLGAFDGLAEHEPLDVFIPREGAEPVAQDTASGDKSGKAEADLGLMDWGASSGDSILDSEPSFVIEPEPPSLEDAGLGGWNEKLILDDEGSLPEVQSSALLDASDMRIADMDDLVEVNPAAEEPLGAVPESLPDAPSSYSYDPVFGRTFDDTVRTTEETPAAFVTETMAELYLQQGFRDEALSVYRRLVEQNPGDEELRARVAHLEQGGAESIRPLADEKIGGEHVERVEQTRTVRSFLSALAARQPSREGSSMPGPGSDPGSGQSKNESSAASASLAMFGDELIPAEDEKAADRLARAYSTKELNDDDGEARGQPSRAASHGLSLDDVFRDAESRAEKTAAAGGFSFDEFFKDASDAEAGRGSGERGSNVGSRDRQEPGKPAASDLEAFNAWLEGLKK